VHESRNRDRLGVEQLCDADYAPLDRLEYSANISPSSSPDAFALTWVPSIVISPFF
jgi:hypothetical protein